VSDAVLVISQAILTASEVTTESAVVVVETVTEVIEAGPSGPQGATGPAGPAGPQGPTGATGGTPYEHIQSTPADEWTIVHNLGHEPIIQVRDSTGRVVGTVIDHLTINSSRSRSAGAFSGKATAI